MVDHEFNNTVVLIGVWFKPSDIPLLVAEGHIEVVNQVKHYIVVISSDVPLGEDDLVTQSSTLGITTLGDSAIGGPIQGKCYPELTTLNDDLITANNLTDLGGVQITEIVSEVADSVVDSITILIDRGWDLWYLRLDLIKCYVELILVSQTVAGQELVAGGIAIDSQHDA